MLSNYVPIIGLFALAAGFAVFSVTAAPYVGPRRYNRAKLDAYECGIEPVHQPLSGGRFPVKYYLTAMLFIVFDIEIVFLYPWARCSSRTPTCGVAADSSGTDGCDIGRDKGGALRWDSRKSCRAGSC
jgi:NADH-quinone oxidoreductase subunit A